uniref:CRAL-TRIO domain-containing protein n=2 Tax=Lotharella globosa TaxID=91324 RepID=A0A6V3MP07_9EUKA
MTATTMAMSPEEAIKKFKGMLTEEDKDPWGTDSTLLRFLRAREYDLDASYKMYTRCLQWRRANKIDQILDNPPKKLEYYKKLVSSKIHGFCKEGRPVYVERVGKIHYPTVLEYLTVDDLIEIHIYHMESLAKLARESSEKLGKDVCQSVQIVDLQGLSMSHRHGLAFIQRCAKVDEQYYPETMGKLFILNAPRLFPFFWGICKAWVHENTQKKIQVVSSNHEEVLREAIPAHFLPCELGGKCNCYVKHVADKKGSEKKQQQMCVPILDLSEMKDKLKYRGDAFDSMAHMSLRVAAGSCEEVLVKGIDAEKGSLFTWNFKTLAKNIEFSITCLPGDIELTSEPKHNSEAKAKDEHEILAEKFAAEFKARKPFALTEAVKCDKAQGSFRSPIPCDLRFTFDNKYSWMTGKDIRHKLTATCLEQ